MAIVDTLKAQFVRQASSRKVQQAIATVAVVILSKPLTRIGFTDAEVQNISITIVAAGVACILGTAHEDAAAKSAPQVQTNVASEVTNAAPKVPSPETIAAAMSEVQPKPIIPGSTTTAERASGMSPVETTKGTP